MWFVVGLSGTIGLSFWHIVRHEGNLRRFTGRPPRHASFFDALCFDVSVPGVLRVPVEVIIMNGDLRDVIRDGGQTPCPCCRQAGYGFLGAVWRVRAIIPCVRGWPG